VDLSGLIFVALAIAWAAYLIPKALRHHDDVVRGRPVDRFSDSMRVLARREPVSARSARLVVGPVQVSQQVSEQVSERAMPEVSPTRAPAPVVRRAASTRATRRRRRVLAVLLLALAGVVAACATSSLAWPYVAIPVGLMVAWLVACRLMVKRERRRPSSTVAPEPGQTDETSASIPLVEVAAPTAEAPEPADPALWDPVPVTLPTYVSKPPARRTVRTIDLDSTGVWTSGRTEADSALAREAEAADRVRRHTAGKGESGEEAVGS
jgi:hypothetical protein